jgi:hypothetical protein
MILEWASNLWWAIAAAIVLAICGYPLVTCAEIVRQRLFSLRQTSV